jgi:hypothetical protein
MSWPTTAARILAHGRDLIGLGEDPPGSNHNKITVAYGEGNGAWCAMTVWYLFHLEGIDLKKEITRGFAATTLAASAAKSKGYWRPGHVGLRAGDIVFFKVPNGDAGFVNHVGIVRACRRTPPSRAIEGNTYANIVAERLRPNGWIVGYMRPPYAAPIACTRPRPLFPAATRSSLGHSNPAVTSLDKQLVRLGYTKHHDGNGYQPGPVFTAFTRDNVKATSSGPRAGPAATRTGTPVPKRGAASSPPGRAVEDLDAAAQAKRLRDRARPRHLPPPWWCAPSRKQSASQA